MPRDLLDYFKRLFESVEREYGGTVQNAHADFYKEQGKGAAGPVLRLRHSDTAGHICCGTTTWILFTWLGGEQIPVLTFHMYSKHMVLDDDICKAVKSVSCNDDTETKLVDILCSVVRKQDATGVDIIQRWQLASDFYREKHPICPVCGNGMSASSRMTIG